MKSLKTLLIFLCAATPLAAADFQPLFNGMDLTGWKGNPDLWSVKEGAIVGTSVGKKIGGNTFLIWQGGDVGDFELRAKLRVSGNNNSGIQYRSEVVDEKNFVVKGYQCDIHPSQNYFGMLYGEKTPRGIIGQRGQKVVVGADGKPNVTGKVGDATEFKLDAWNEFTIIAKGNRMMHKVNGIVTLDITDDHPEASRTGVIAFQVHAGPEMTAYIKDVRLKKLGGAAAPKALEKKGKKEKDPLATWIWGKDDNKPQQFRKQFELPPLTIKSAKLYARCDNAMTIWINGKPVTKDTSWESPTVMDVAKHLKSGARNVIAVLGENQGGPAGLVVNLKIGFAGGDSVLVNSGKDWRVSDAAQGDWQSAGFSDLKWGAPREIAKLGGGPWAGGGGGGSSGGSPHDPDALELAEGFKAELLYTVPKDVQGSWVALTKGPDGSLIASDQGGKGLYRIHVDDEVTVEKIPVELSGAQGLVWAFDSLYVHVSGKGLFRVRDKNGDGKLDDVETLPGANGGGEHGNHGLILTEDGKALYVAAGNHTNLPEIAGTRVANWKEDLLLPRQWDARGHARGRLAPGGWVCRVTPDGKSYEVYCIGFRNEYDIALNRFGDLFTFDADMEWDMGSPWYIPTRICHAVSGADYGWRSGTGKWPNYYEDSLPPLVDIGPGSPTGVASGLGAKFPTKFQDAIFALDWTFGTIHAIHPTPDGAGYRGEAEEFVSGSPLPVSDAVIGDDGAFYFTVGGRNTQSALYRVTYTGSESTAAPTGEGPPEAAKARALRRKLEAFHGREDSSAVATSWPHLGSADRFLRHAARVAIESQPLAQWRNRALQETDAQTAITALVALARVGTEADRKDGLKALLKLSGSQLEASQKLGWLRALALNFIRLGSPSEEERSEIVAFLSPQLPSENADLNTELVRLLVYLDAPGVVEKTIPLIVNRSEPEVPEWSELIARNGGYGGTIRKILDNPPPTREIDYAFMLRNVRFSLRRNVRVGWNMRDRRAYFTFINEASKYPGGASFTGFLKNIRDDALANCSQEERAALADLTGEKLQQDPDFEIKPPVGPGRAWTVDAAVAYVEKNLKKRNFERGRSLFHAVACAACHRFDGLGGDVGPDLSSVKNKFGLRDLMESIIEPSKTISDQYGSSAVKLRDGRSLAGVAVLKGNTVEVYSSDPKAPPTIARKADVVSVEPVPISQMPPALINSLSPDELSDLVAYLYSWGSPKDPMFRK